MILSIIPKNSSRITKNKWITMKIFLLNSIVMVKIQASKEVSMNVMLIHQLIGVTRKFMIWMQYKFLVTMMILPKVSQLSKVIKVHRDL